MNTQPFNGPGHRVHVGRQPVYDREYELVGYELLFRGGPTASAAAASGAQATSRVLVNLFSEFGMDQLTGGRLAFINLTGEFLRGELPLPFDPEGTVLEILETVEVTDEVIDGVRALVDRGFTIALDDFVFGRGHEPLLELASYVKLDVLGVEPTDLAAQVHACRRHPHLKLLAERVETPEDVRLTRDLGFDLFQGYAFGRSQVLSLDTLAPSRLRYLELIDRLLRPDIEMDEVTAMVQSDPALAYRVLRAANSASAGLSRKVSSIHDAVLLMGLTRLRHWLILMTVSDLTGTSAETVVSVLVRARLCQTLADRAGVAGEQAFTAGLLSGLSDMLAVSPESLVARLSLDTELAGAVTGSTGRLGSLVAVAREYDKGGDSAELLLPVVAEDLARSYLSAVSWAMRATAAVRD